MYIEYKKGEKHSSKNADISDNLDSFEDAGYLLDENDLIVDIDCLDKAQIKQLIKDFNIKTRIVWTDRGCHMYFKKPENFRRAQGVTCLGFKVEYKHIKNTKSITVKRNGVARDVENDNIRESLPDCLTTNTRNLDLLGLSEGDGRNEKLFRQRKIINNLPSWKKIVTFINTCIFSEPLPLSELDLICRDMTIEAEKDGETVIADLIMEEKSVVKFNNDLYFYDGKNYINDKDLLDRMVYSYCSGQKTRYVNEVIEQMRKRAKIIKPDTVFDIKFKNGILRKGEFIEIDYKGFTPYYIDINYNPEAKPVKEVDDYLSHLCNSEEDYKMLVTEVLGHCLITDEEIKRLIAKFYFFVGDGGNGKGTLLSIINKIVQPHNASTLSIENMTDERYLNSMQGKLVNLGDDIEDKALNNKQMKILKNISTCDAIPIRKLYESSKDMRLTTTMIFTSNHILKSFEKGESYKRRVLWLPMYTKPKKKDPRFITKLTTTEALEYWVKLMVNGYIRLYQNGKHTFSKLVNDFNEQYHEENNTALQYIKDLTKDSVLGKTNPDVYKEYELWCETNGVNTQTAKLFKDTTEKYFKISVKQKKINGKNMRVYVDIPAESFSLSEG